MLVDYGVIGIEVGYMVLVFVVGVILGCLVVGVVLDKWFMYIVVVIGMGLFCVGSYIFVIDII